MRIRGILAIAMGLSLGATAFAAEPLVKMQVGGPLAKLAVDGTLAKLANANKFAQLTSTAPSVQTTEAKKPMSRASRFQALYGDSAADDDQAIADAVNKASETGSQIRGLLNKDAAPKAGIRGLLNKPQEAPTSLEK